MKNPLALLFLGVLVAGSAGLVLGDEHGKESRSWLYFSGQDVMPVKQTLYSEECGSCHFAYQPGLLPKASWLRMLDQLEDHFGENAELDAQTRDQLVRYLGENAADQVSFGRSPRFAEHTASLRITDSRYFQRKHHEIPQQWVLKNPGVGSFSNCDSCHTKAGQGSYDEHAVVIPGHGRWED